MLIGKSNHPDIITISPKIFEDSRGFFMEIYHKEKFYQAGIKYDFVQDNHSRSTQYSLRGLHYQTQKPQGKLVRVIFGEIYDVAVDLRRNSIYFGTWIAEIISSDNQKQLWIPPGFAHGFLTLSEYAEVLYKTTDYYSPEYEECIRWDDPDLSIEWPLPIGVNPVLSEKDTRGKKFNLIFF